MENLNWSELGFGYIGTDYNVRCYYRDGKRGELEVSSSEIISIHMTATCLHYGQELFEGSKAFRGKGGEIHVFCMDKNAKRMQSSGRGIRVAESPVEMLEEVIRKVMKSSGRSTPPYESGAALYTRPLMISLDAQVGVKPAPEYMFIVFVAPVDPYFRGGFQPSKVYMSREYNHAAPNGIGTIKVDGNYAANLVAGEIIHSKGYAAVLYLNPKEEKYLDEYGPVNFFRIRDNNYITPQSHSTLPSITNKSLQQLAEDMGLAVERHPVPFEEAATFNEAAECGTVAVIIPISQADDLDKSESFVITKDGKPGSVCEKLYHKLRAIRYDDEPDTYGWVSITEQCPLLRKDWDALRLYETEYVDR